MSFIIVVFVTIALLVLTGQGQRVLNSIASSLSSTFWESVVVLLLALASIPFVLILGVLTAIVILSALALIIALIIIAVNSPIFRGALDITTVCPTLFIRIMVLLQIWVVSIRASTHASKFESTSLLKSELASKNISYVVPTLEPLQEPRQFKKRRPIRYSGAKPVPPLDPRNDAQTRLMAHIARLRSKAYKPDGYKVNSAPMQDYACTTADAATTKPTQFSQETNLFVPFTYRALAETNLPVVQIFSRFNVRIETHDNTPNLVININRKQQVEPTVPIALSLSPSQTSPSVETKTRTTGLESLLPPLEPPVSPTTSASVHEICSIINIYSPEISIPKSPIPSTSEEDSPLSPRLVHEPVYPTVTESTGHLSLAGAVLPIASKPVTIGHIVSHIQSSVPEPQTETFISSPVLSESEDNRLDLVSTEIISSSIETIPHPIQTDQSAPIYDRINQPTSNTLSPGDILQAEMDMLVAPTYQETHTGLGQVLEGFVDTPATPGMVAPATIDISSQSRYMSPMPDATLASELGLAAIPNPADNYRVSELDTQMGSDTPLSSDAELLKLAAEALAAEGMEWDHYSLPFEHCNEDVHPPTVTNQDLLELDYFLQMPATSLLPSLPQTPNNTLTISHTFPDFESPAPIITDEEFLGLASAAIAEGLSGMLLENGTSVNYNTDFSNTDTSLLDPNAMELLDQATKSIIADLVNQVSEPSGTLNPINLSIPGLADPSDFGHTDPTDLASMWDELGASLKVWTEQVPGGMGYSDEDMMQLLIELDTLDPTCPPSHTTLNPTSEPAPPTHNSAPPAPPNRKIKKLPLRRTAIENHSKAMMSQRA